MTRKATELDNGSRIIVGGAIRTVVRIHDHFNSMGAHTTLVLDNGCSITDRAATLYTCLA